MKILSSILILSIFFQHINCLFIRSNKVYHTTIKNIYEFYYCKSITILYSNNNIKKITEMESKTRLMNFQLNFSKLFIPIIVIDIKMFASKVNENVNNIHDSLIVLLNDSEDIKYYVNKLFNQPFDFSKSIWLIFSNDEEELEEYFKDIYIPFNSKFMVSKKNNTSQYSETILEIFKVNRNSKLFHNIFTTWDPKNDIEFPKHSLNVRRNQLYGLNLRTVIIHTLPTMSISYTNNGQIHVGGMFGEIVDILKVAMNFTITYIITEQFGNFEENRWTGAVGLLVRNESDFFPGYMGMTSSRLGVIDYTKPLFLSNDRFFYSQPSPSLKWNQFLKPFNHDIWLAIMLSILLFSISITYLEFIYQEKNSTSLIRTIFIKIMINLMFVFNAFCGKTDVRSEVNSIAIVQYVIHLAVVVLSAAYSGILISSLTTNSDMPDFKTMKNFHDDSKYTMGLLRGSTYLHLFRNSTDEIMKKMVEKTITNNGLTSSNTEGFERACSDHTYAFYTTDITKYYFNPKDCVLLASESIMRLSISFGLQYNSPFKDVMNYYIIWLRTSGIMNRILSDWAEYKYQQSESGWKPVEFIEVAAIVIYYIIAVIGSTIILWGEKIIYKKRRQQKFATVFNRLITNNKYPVDNSCIVPIK